MIQAEKYDSTQSSFGSLTGSTQRVETANPSKGKQERKPWCTIEYLFKGVKSNEELYQRRIQIANKCQRVQCEERVMDDALCEVIYVGRNYVHLINYSLTGTTIAPRLVIAI